MTNRHVPLHAAGAFFLLAVTLAVAGITAQRRPGRLAQPLDTIPYRIAGLTGTNNQSLGEDVLRQLKASSYLTRTYERAGFTVDLFISFYAEQRAGESMHSPKHCLPGGGWEIWNYDSIGVPVGDRSYTVNKYSISRDSTRKLVLYWYQSKERIVASEYLGKLLLAGDTLMRNSTAASIVRIIVPDRPGATEQARAFASELIPQIERCFGSVR
jgi:EpsI family protein